MYLRLLAFVLSFAVFSGAMAGAQPSPGGTRLSQNSAPSERATLHGTSTSRSEVSGGTAGIPDLKDMDSPPSELRGVLERYRLDLESLRRSYAVRFSAACRARFRQFYRDWQSWLAAQAFDDWSVDGRVDYVLFRNHLEYELHRLDIDTKQLAEIEALIPMASLIVELEDSRHRMGPIDAHHAAALLAQLQKRTEQVHKALELGLRPASQNENRDSAKAPQESDHQAEKPIEPIKTNKYAANRAAMAVNDLRTLLKNWSGFYNGYDPNFTWWAGAPYKNADLALESYRAFLSERVVGIKAGDKEAIVGSPIGRDALLVELAHEMIPYTPEELLSIAQKELAWCDSEMIKASRAAGYGDDWHKAVEHVKDLIVDPGKQPELIRKLALEAIGFVDQRGLVTIPELAREDWQMEMMTPERQLVNPFFTGGQTISVSYPTDTMTYEQKLNSMRGNNIHFARATVFHELIPGHHLQMFMNARYKNYRRIFQTPFSGEGWALYWELLMWDLGFPQSPENRIGMLFWRMHRCARIIFSLSFHLGRMTPQECVDFLIERVGHEPENARAEVRRSFAPSTPPLYQASYLLGGLQFYSLRRELVDSRKMSERAFHDAILHENSIPVEMVRVLLSGQKVQRQYVPGWRFYRDTAKP